MINKIHKPMPNWPKEREDPINKSRDKKEVLEQTPMESRSLVNTMKTYFPESWKNLDEMDKFLNTYDLPKLKPEDK